MVAVIAVIAVVEDSCLFTAKGAKGREGGGDFPRRMDAGEKAPLAWRRWGLSLPKAEGASWPAFSLRAVMLGDHLLFLGETSCPSWLKILFFSPRRARRDAKGGFSPADERRGKGSARLRRWGFMGRIQTMGQDHTSNPCSDNLVRI
mgnify:CR=1 FL=1